MSVENLRVDEPSSKGWANLYMNNLTVYDTISAKRVLTTGVLEDVVVPYVYNGSVTPLNFTIAFRETGGLVNLHTLVVSYFIPANDSANIRLQPVTPLSTLYRPKRSVAYPVWMVVDGVREICVVEISASGDIYLYRPPAAGGALQSFPAGDIAEFWGDPTFTYVRG